MFILHLCAPPFQLPPLSHLELSRQSNQNPPFPIVSISVQTFFRHKKCLFIAELSRNQRMKSTKLEDQIEEDNVHDDIDYDDDEDEDGFSDRSRFRGREEEKDYDRNPEFAEILGSCLDDPAKARSKMEERLRKKRSKILHTKTGSATPMKVTFKKFDFSNSYIWFEFYNAPLEQDVSLICNTIRSWHIIGRLGGCNSMNMQLSQSPLDKRPSYDTIRGANVNPATFYNIGDLEIQDNLARIWVDIGTSEPLLLDILINALTQLSSE
ncbi:unnamed protein product [Ilex paraguariensis]|uniref:Uncharacterized protein n=1 Tax=Ilex paraguariensis TaxID=185542 RepID=A0ABC8S9D8_9AQUA